MGKSVLLKLLAIAAFLASSHALAASTQEKTKMTDSKKPLVIAHRGASGLRPEHTIPSYRLGITEGADFIEPDLVMTRDGHFVARHDIYLSSTTDISVRPEFADRKRDIEGKTDWYVFDFTLAELKTLKARQPFDGRSKDYDDQFAIPTLEEIVALVLGAKDQGRVVGLYPELKRPDIYENLGLDPASRMAAQLNAIHGQGIPMFFQCFFPDFLVKIDPLVEAVPLILLIGAKEEDGVVKPYLDYNPYFDHIDGLGLSKALMQIGPTPGSYMATAQGKGLKVHLWTIRDDSVPTQFSSVQEELSALIALGVDGLFTDFPGTMRRFLSNQAGLDPKGH